MEYLLLLFLQKLLLVTSEKANYLHITRLEFIRHLRIISLDEDSLSCSPKPKQ